MILVDFNQFFMSTVFSNVEDLKAANGDVNKVESMIRHLLLNKIKYFNSRYRNRWGEMVICCDGRKYWRRRFYKGYKSKRKPLSDRLGIPDEIFYAKFDAIKDDIRDYFPYKLMLLNNVEADDIISTLVIYSQRSGESVLILSTDNDFIQLQRYPNVKQLSPTTEQFIAPPDLGGETHMDNIERKLITHIVKGDSGDAVPNILSPLDVFSSGKRQSPVKKAFLEEFFKRGEDACENDDMRKRWKLNRKLVDLRRMPNFIMRSIMNKYREPQSGDMKTLEWYLLENKCKNIIPDIKEFEMKGNI